jgi:alpha-1,6-mannosyltransferase
MELYEGASRFSMITVILSHVGILSQLGHKETRFISYVVPLLNMFAAKGALVLWQPSTKSSSFAKVAGRISVLLAVVATVLVTVVSTRASAGNYPGGEAIQAFHRVVQQGNGEQCQGSSWRRENTY